MASQTQTEVTINQAKNIMREMLKSPSQKRLATFLHSPPGIGKSSIVNQLSDEINEQLVSKAIKDGNMLTVEAYNKLSDKDKEKYNTSGKIVPVYPDGEERKLYGFIDVRLACMPEYDVQGIPFIKNMGTGNEEMVYSVPDWFPSKEKVAKGLCPAEGTLFLDELSNASNNTQQAAYRIVLDGAVHGAVMAPGWKIVAAGNLKTDNTGAKNILPALANRFATHLTIKPSVDDFVGYAIERKLRREVIGFVTQFRQHLYDAEGAKRNASYATPRSWEYVSNLLDIYSGHDNMLYPVLAGCIGDAMTTQFTTFLKYNDKLPDFDLIMKGKADYKLDKKDAGLVFALTSSLMCLLVEHHENPTYLTNLNKVLLKQLDNEFLTLIFKTLVFHKDRNVVRNVYTHEDCKKTFGKVAEFIL